MATTWTAWIESDAWRSEAGALPLKSRLLSDALAVALDDDVEARRLIRLVAREPVLTAAMLRLANSAAHSALRPASTVDQAVVRVGTRAVRSLVLSTCFAASGADPGQQAPDSDYIEHGIGTACIAGLVATRVGVDADEAFVGGLLHDIGKLFLANLRRQFVRAGGPAPAASEEDVVMRARYALVGGVALAHWGLPDALCEPVRWHHDPLSAPRHQQTAAIVHVANRLSHRLGFGCPADPQEGPGDDAVCLTLGLTGAWIDEAAERAVVLFEAARQFGLPRPAARVAVCAS